MILNTLMSMDTEWCDSEIFLQPQKDPRYIEASNNVQKILKEIELVDPGAGKYDNLSQRLAEAFNWEIALAMEACYKRGFQSGAKHIISCLSGEINNI